MKLDRLAYTNVLKHAAYICPISHGTANLMKRYFAEPLQNTPLQVTSIGTNHIQYVPHVVALHRSPSNTPTIISVGEVKPRKGYHVSLAAFARVKDQFPSARYLIVGRIDQENYYNQLQQFITDHQLRDVEFLGVVSDEKLQQYYQQASVFLLAPQQEGFYFEGFGFVYLEAGAHGLPVVGARAGGVPDAVVEGVTGFLADPNDVDGIAQALLRLLTDTGLARQMGRANREWAETLTWERYAQDQYQVYQACLTRYMPSSAASLRD
jgi:phosphatidylinositol alpha-1,6-mannosyltransferase